jgi:hypothetical protein
MWHIIQLVYISAAAAFAQDGSLQRESIRQLEQNRNRTIVPTCSLENRLNCVLQNIDNSLIIDDHQTSLQNISIGVVTCNSSISPVLTLSNATMVERDNLRCPTTIPLGQFNLIFDLDVYFNESINFTIIDIMVSWYTIRCQTRKFKWSEHDNQ